MANNGKSWGLIGIIIAFFLFSTYLYIMLFALFIGLFVGSIISVITGFKNYFKALGTALKR